MTSMKGAVEGCTGTRFSPSDSRHSIIDVVFGSTRMLRFDLTFCLLQRRIHPLLTMRFLSAHDLLLLVAPHFPFLSSLPPFMARITC